MALVHGIKPIVTSGLVLCLDAANRKSYPGTGTAWTDLSGNGNHGTLNNGVGYNSANGGSLVFDGIDDEARVSAGTWSWTSVLSIGFFIYPISSAHTFGRITSTTSDRFEIGISPAGELSWFTGAWRTTGLTLTFNAWSYVTFSQIGPSGNPNNLNIYINAVLQSPTGLGNDFFSANTASGGTFYIGRKETGAEGTNIRISNLQVYNRALSATEVAQNYNALKGRYGLS